MLNMYKRILQGRLIKYSDSFFIPYIPCIKRAENFTVNLVCNFHTSSTIKTQISLTENVFAFNILNRNLILKNEFIKKINPVIFTEHDFNNFLNKNWRNSSAVDIVDAFLTIKDFCITNNIKLSETRFDKLVDGLMDHCEELTTQELLNLLNCLCELPACDAFFSHNFHDIWSCLDDICCWKMIEWDIETCLTVANIWYKLNIAKVADFIFEMLGRMVKRADFLTKDQLVQIFFCFNVCRNRSVDFEYEYALENQIKNMTVDEMAIVAMGYFKTKTKIKSLAIIENMVDQVTQNSKGIHEISLAAILKIIRFSKPYLLSPKINQMLDKLVHEIPRLSELCCLHIALVSTGIQTYHAETIKPICDKLIVNIHDPAIIRLKDIERILNVLTMYDFDPKTEPDVFSTCLKEMHTKERLQEEIKHPKALLCALHFLSLRNLYSYELMDRILAPDYIKHNFGKTAKTLPLDVFSLDCSIDIECSGYSGNRLSPNLKYKAAKWLTEFTPSPDQYKKITATDKLILDTIDIVEKIVGGKQYMYIQHVLPHFRKADIIICKNMETDTFVEPLGFQNYVFGDVMFSPFHKNLKWFAIVIVGWNNTIRETSFPLGHMLMKKRQLKKIGYHPVLVIWNEFLNLSPAGRELYLLNKLNN